jgi:MtN3 and saliva related transmembrane protein
MIAIVLGTIAAVFSVVAFVPQAWRVIRTRQTKDLATPMWILNVCGFATWTAYGAYAGAWPLIVPNVICCVLSAFILTMKLASPPTRDRIADALTPESRNE